MAQKNRILFYFFGAIAGAIIISSIAGTTVAFYKQKGRIKALAKSLYYRFPKKTNSRIKIVKPKKSDSKTEIALDIHPGTNLNFISPLIFGSNLSPQSETNEDIVKLVKYLGITCFRFPGGESPGYHWKTAEFDFTNRYTNAPLRDFNNLLAFCKRTNTTLIIQVNIESGTPKEAADWVWYLNKKMNLSIKYWELGNEVYGDWDKAYTSPEKYAKLIANYANEMKKVDPSIKIGADWAPERNKRFNDTVAQKAGKHIDFVSIHWYPNHTSANHRFDKRIHPDPKEVMANYLQIPKIITNVKKTFRKFHPYSKKEVEVTFLEWDGAWDGPTYDLKPYSQEGIIQWSLANAIFYADCLGQFIQNGVAASTQFNLQSTMFGMVRGWEESVDPYGQRWDKETIRPKALALKLFAQNFGDILIKSEIQNSPTYFKEQDSWPDSYSGEVPYISCYASKFKNANKIVLILINKHAEDDLKIKINIQGNKLLPEAKLLILNGPQITSQNEGNPANVRIREFRIENMKNEFQYIIPAHSINLLEVKYEK